jgi:hypothetical protein
MTSTETLMLLRSWLAEEEKGRSFTGWDFSYLDNRMFEELPWDYMAMAAHLMQSADSVLDMGTGGGERLLELHPYWPAKVIAPKKYLPNLTLSRQRLEPLGVKIFHVAI